MGGVGRLGPAPGTVASALAAVAAYFLAQAGPLALIAGAVMTGFIGLWAVRIYLAGAKSKDPGEVVIDEVCGQWLALALVPLDPLLFGLGFLLFRLFDVLKPWPINWAQGRFSGAIGVMIDDVLAGIAAGVLTLAIAWGISHGNV